MASPLSYRGTRSLSRSLTGTSRVTPCVVGGTHRLLMQASPRFCDLYRRVLIAMLRNRGALIQMGRQGPLLTRNRSTGGRFHASTNLKLYANLADWIELSNLARAL